MSIPARRYLLGCLIILLVVSTALAGGGSKGTGEAIDRPPSSFLPTPASTPVIQSFNSLSKTPTSQPTPEFSILGASYDPSIDIKAGPVELPLVLQIPAIKVDAPVVQGDGWEQLKKGVGQHVGTTNPGKDGNLVLSAHNDIFGEIFRDLDQLQPGDEIILFTNQRSYTYTVVDSEVVEPTAVEVMDATKQPTVTLISCYPYLVDDQRIVVTARLQG